MGGEDYGAGAVEDSVAGVGREVFQELAEVGLGELGSCFLGGSKLAEGDEEIVVDCVTLI